MTSEGITGWKTWVAIDRFRSALSELFSQEFSFSTGHLATILSGCLFAPSLLTFWFVNGLLDFSTALAIGAVATPAGLQVRLLAYLLLVPVFLGLRLAIHLIHPEHRRQVLSGACPNARYLSLDWFSVGILATGLPLALRNLGPWLGMNLTFLVGIFVIPQWLSDRTSEMVKLAAIAVGSVLFLYANYGHAAPVVPDPSTVVGPIATLTLSDSATNSLMQVVNSVLFGPALVAGFALTMNYLLTRPELTEIPIVSLSLPQRDPDRVVLVSAAIGTEFYLLVAAAATGQLIVLP